MKAQKGVLATSVPNKILHCQADWLISQSIPNPVVESWERHYLTNPSTARFHHLIEDLIFVRPVHG